MGRGELENLLQRMKGQPPGWLAALRKELAVDRISGVTFLNLEKLSRTFLPLAGGPEAMQGARALGLLNLTQLTSVSGLGKTGCLSRTRVSWTGEPQGVFKLLDAPPLSAADLEAVPRDPTLAVATKLDLEKVLDVFVELLGAINPRAKEEFLHDIREADEASGIPFREEILRPLGDTLRLYDSPSEGGLLVGLTAVILLKDPRAAAATHEKLLKNLQDDLQEVQNSTSHYNRLFTPRIEKIAFRRNTIYLFSPGEGRCRFGTGKKR